MSGYEFWAGYWWIFPVIMMAFCFLFMRKSRAGRFCGFGCHSCHSDAALDVLGKRYAKGEIDREEYEEKKKDLQS